MSARRHPTPLREEVSLHVLRTCRPKRAARVFVVPLSVASFLCCITPAVAEPTVLPSITGSSSPASGLTALGLHGMPASKSPGFASAQAGHLSAQAGHLLTGGGEATTPTPLVAKPATANTYYVNGISDNTLPYWDGTNVLSQSYFYANIFQPFWIGQRPHKITLSRYVVPWDIILHQNPADQSYMQWTQFVQWYNDVKIMGLVPQISFTYTANCLYTVSTCLESPVPQNLAIYEQETQALLAAFPASFVEPWNEPNLGQVIAPLFAAQLSDSIYNYCEAPGGPVRCYEIAGNLADSPSNFDSYYQTLKTHQIDPKFWAIHPYSGVNNYNEDPNSFANFQYFLSNLPSPSTDYLAISEVGARVCNDGIPESPADTDQAALFIGYLLTEFAPFEVNYFGYLDKGRYPPAPCPGTHNGNYDTFLYKAGPNGTDVTTGDGLPATYVYNGSQTY
jgi:hypothetical protein